MTYFNLEYCSQNKALVSVQAHTEATFELLEN